jgi:NOL1/NOP2/fmu family ribosome biogenesis protein
MNQKKFIRLKILNKTEKRGIEKDLYEQFGIKSIPGIVLRRGWERLFLFTGDFSKEDLEKLEEIIPIERVGVYFAKIVNGGVKLSIEGVHLLKDKIRKNIFDLNQTQVEEWMKGQDLQVKTGKYGFLVMKYKDDFLGMGRASEEKIGNYIPKSRRLKNKGGG